MKMMKLIYWLVPLILIFLQYLLTSHASNQIRFEEMKASVQAPLWFSQRLLIAGDTNNIGWYGLLVIVYKLFGFTLYTARYMLLFFYGVFLYSLAWFLKKYYPTWVSLILVVTLGLSPTLMFINTLALHWAMVPLLTPIFLILLTQLDFKNTKASLFLEGLIFFLFIVEWVTYPAFVFMIPAFGMWYLLKLKKNCWLGERKFYLHLAASLFFFVLPLIFLYIYIQNNSILFYDPDERTGLLRGGGRIVFSSEVFAQELTAFFGDLFNRAASYHFEVGKVEFSDLYPLITFLFVLFVTWKVYKQKRNKRLVIALTVMTILLNLTSIGILADQTVAGMRRGIPVLIGFYFLYCIVWYYLQKSSIKLPWKKYVSYGILLLLTFHHLAVYPINLSHITDKSTLAVLPWLDINQTPQQSLDAIISVLVKNDIKLNCLVILERYSGCDYVLIYSALKASCLWNDVKCHRVEGFDLKNKAYVPISVELLHDRYFDR